MLVTLLGMLTDVRPVHPEKALFAMPVTSLGMTVDAQPLIRMFDEVSIIALQLLRESYVVFPLSTSIEVNPLQPSYLQLAVYQFVLTQTVEK